MKNLFLLSILLTTTLHAIVAIKPRVVGDKPGFSGSITASFDTKRGNTETDNYKGAVKVLYDNNISHLIWGMLSYEYGEANSVKNTNKIFSHLRYIGLTTIKNFNKEAYIQASDDEFKGIKNRLLAGGGMRYKIFGNDYYGRTYVGMSAYIEHIIYGNDAIDPTENNVRGNFNLAYQLPLNEDSEFNALAYYQPRVDAPSDFYSSATIGFQLHVYLSLFLNFKITHEYDSEPAIGVLKEDIASSTEFVFKF